MLKLCAPYYQSIHEISHLLVLCWIRSWKNNAKLQLPAWTRCGSRLYNLQHSKYFRSEFTYKILEAWRSAIRRRKFWTMVHYQTIIPMPLEIVKLLLFYCFCHLSKHSAQKLTDHWLICLVQWFLYLWLLSSERVTTADSNTN